MVLLLYAVFFSFHSFPLSLSFVVGFGVFFVVLLRCLTDRRKLKSNCSIWKEGKRSSWSPPTKSAIDVVGCACENFKGYENVNSVYCNAEIVYLFIKCMVFRPRKRFNLQFRE